MKGRPSFLPDMDNNHVKLGFTYIYALLNMSEQSSVFPSHLSLAVIRLSSQSLS